MEEGYRLLNRDTLDRGNFKFDKALVEKSKTRTSPSKVVPEGNWWDWKIFPSDCSHPFIKAKEYDITPDLLAEALGRYASGTETIKSILEAYGWSNDKFCLILNRFPMVKQTYNEAKRAKADMYASEAVDLYQRDIPAEFWTFDRDGNKVLTMAGVRYLEGKSSTMMRMAQAHEAGTYQNKTQVDSRNLNVSVDSGLDLSDLLSMDIEGLMKPND